MSCSTIVYPKLISVHWLNEHYVSEMLYFTSRVQEGVCELFLIAAWKCILNLVFYDSISNYRRFY